MKHSLAENDWLGVVYRMAEGVMGASPRCHDWDHTLRVTCNAEKIASGEGADTAVVKTGALLHDIGRAMEVEGQPGGSCHAKVGEEKAYSLLCEAGVKDEVFIQHVAECIRCHRYRNAAAEYPGTLEAKVVFDADKLDAMGAIGIGRAFYFAGRNGARVHNSREEALEGESYGQEDTAHREYLVKLADLKDCMYTRTGRRMAEERARFMDAFFTRLERETEC